MSPKKTVNPDKDLPDVLSITSIQELIDRVYKDVSTWDPRTRPLFRGEPRDIPNSLLPKLFRSDHDEMRLLREFRMKSPALGLEYVPPRDYTDQWLFLAQHVRLPTRLLDWTEGLLIALHFALYSREDGGIVWMLNPDALNQLTNSTFEPNQAQFTGFSERTFPMQVRHLEVIANMIKSGGKYKPWIPDNISILNINYAWEQDGKLTPYPISIPPTNIHPRMSRQASRFTIHGQEPVSMCQMGLGPNILRRYDIADEAIPPMKDEVRMMGITHSSLFPELDGLSDELASIY